MYYARSHNDEILGIHRFTAAITKRLLSLTTFDATPPLRSLPFLPLREIVPLPPFI